MSSKSKQTRAALKRLHDRAVALLRHDPGLSHADLCGRLREEGLTPYRAIRNNAMVMAFGQDWKKLLAAGALTPSVPPQATPQAAGRVVLGRLAVVEKIFALADEIGGFARLRYYVDWAEQFEDAETAPVPPGAPKAPAAGDDVDAALGGWPAAAPGPAPANRTPQPAAADADADAREGPP